MQLWDQYTTTPATTTVLHTLIKTKNMILVKTLRSHLLILNWQLLREIISNGDLNFTHVTLSAAYASDTS